MSVMTAISDDTAAATAAATVLEQLLDGDIVFSVGQVQVGAPADELLPAPDARTFAVRLGGDEPGLVALALAPRLATALEQAESGQDLLVTVAPALAEAVMAIQQSGAVLDGSEPTEIPAGSVAGAEDSEVAVVGLLEGSERLATLVVRIGPDAATPADAGEGPAAGATAAPHEFQPLEPGVAVSPIHGHTLELLNDVEMRVTVELGRTRMKVRDLLALTAGAVIELDRATGSPVNVLVNGKLIARGEVVVIDEEFGIRISEIVGGGVDGKRMI